MGGRGGRTDAGGFGSIVTFGIKPGFVDGLSAHGPVHGTGRLAGRVSPPGQDDPGAGTGAARWLARTWCGSVPGTRGSAWTSAADSRGIACSRACSAATVSSWAWTAVMSGSTTISHSARIWWPIQRSRTCPVSSTPGTARRVFSAWIDQRGVDGVHQPPVDLAGRLPQHGQDRHGDHQADDRVGPVPAQRDPARAQQHGQRGQSVGAGVQPVGDQRGRADLAAGADPVPGRELVARESGQRGGGDRDQVRDVMRVQQAGDRLVGGQRRGRRDGQRRSRSRPGPRRGRTRRCSGGSAGGGPARTPPPAGPRSARRPRCAACRPAAPPIRTPRSPPPGSAR